MPNTRSTKGNVLQCKQTHLLVASYNYIPDKIIMLGLAWHAQGANIAIYPQRASDTHVLNEGQPPIATCFHITDFRKHCSQLFPNHEHSSDNRRLRYDILGLLLQPVPPFNALLLFLLLSSWYLFLLTYLSSFKS